MQGSRGNHLGFFQLCLGKDPFGKMYLQQWGDRNAVSRAGRAKLSVIMENDISIQHLQCFQSWFCQQLVAFMIDTLQSQQTKSEPRRIALPSLTSNSRRHFAIWTQQRATGARATAPQASPTRALLIRKSPATLFRRASFIVEHNFKP